MDFTFSEEQVLLRDSLSGYLGAHYGFAARRAAGGWRPEIWQGFARELGILGIGLPEARGGLGGGAVEHMIVMEQFGHHLVAEPYLETVVIGAWILGQMPGARAANLLGAVLAGEQRIAFAWAEPTMRYHVADIAAVARRDGQGWRLDARKSVVSAAPWADTLIVAARTAGKAGDVDGLSLFLVDKTAAGLTEHAYATIDGRRAADLVLDTVELPADALLGTADKALPLIEQAIDRATAALCAEAVGAMRKLHRDTIDYTGQRRQFDQPLANFQALQHRMVDMHMQIEMAHSATYLATLSLDATPAQRARAVSVAKVTTGHAARFVGQNAVQLHGGMGMSDDLPIGHYFKRCTVIESEFGNVDHHLARYARLRRAA